MTDILPVIVPSVVSSLIVGMTAAWLASQRALASYQLRLAAVETAVERIEARDRDVTERLVRLETKMDLLLANIGYRKEEEAA